MLVKDCTFQLGRLLVLDPSQLMAGKSILQDRLGLDSNFKGFKCNFLYKISRTLYRHFPTANYFGAECRLNYYTRTLCGCQRYPTSLLEVLNLGLCSNFLLCRRSLPTSLVHREKLHLLQYNLLNPLNRSFYPNIIYKMRSIQLRPSLKIG